MGMIIRNSCGATSNTSMCSLISLQLVGVGQSGQIGVNLIAGKEGDYSSAGVRNAFFAIQTACGDNLYERLRITTAGKIGIGCTTPQKNLTVDGCIGMSNTYNWGITNDNDANWGFRVCSTGVNYSTFLSYAGDAGSDRRGGIYNQNGHWVAYGNCQGHFIVQCNVGIGTTTPNAPLDVTSTTSSSSGIQQWSYNSAPASYRLQLNTLVCSGLVRYSFDMLNAGASYNCVLTFDRGNVGIGTSSPSERLHIYGTGAGPEVRLEGTWGSHYMRAYNDNWNFLTAGGRIAIAMNNLGSVFNYQNTTTWQQTSDIRIKENINEISNSLNLIKALKPVSFDYKQEFAEKNNWDDTMKLNNVGFIAQEFETVFPKYVSMNNYTLGDTLIEDFKSIDTGHLVPYIIKAMQEQQCTIDSLKTCLGIS
jgi:hypothetical protein